MGAAEKLAGGALHPVLGIVEGKAKRGRPVRELKSERPF